MEALRIALLLVMIRCTSRVAPRAAQLNVRFLMESLDNQNLDWTNGQDSASDSTSLFPEDATTPQHELASLDTQQYRLLLFILLTAHFNALLATDSSQSWFLDRAVYIASSKLGFSRHGELDEMMRQYLYNPIQ